MTVLSIELLKKWWRDWAKVDIVALGLGVSISWGYVVYRSQNPGLDSPYLDIWSDLGAGLLGAWLSVRLIDTIIQTREQRHSTRVMLWGNLNYVRGLARTLLPRIYKFDVISLNDELMWARERMPYRERHLYKSEIDGINEVLVEMESLVQQSRHCLQIKRKVGECRSRIRSILDELNESRYIVKRSLDQVNEYKDQDSYRTLALGFSDLLDQHRQAFSPAEAAQLQTYCRQLDTVQNKDRFLDLYYDRPRVERLYEHEIGWFSKVEREYDKMQEWKDFDLQALHTIVDEAKMNIAADHLPTILSDSFADYLNSIESEADQRLRVEETITRLIGVIDKTRADITEESELD